MFRFEPRIRELLPEKYRNLKIPDWYSSFPKQFYFTDEVRPINFKIHDIVKYGDGLYEIIELQPQTEPYIELQKVNDNGCNVIVRQKAQEMKLSQIIFCDGEYNSQILRVYSDDLIKVTKHSFQKLIDKRSKYIKDCEEKIKKMRVGLNNLRTCNIAKKFCSD